MLADYKTSQFSQRGLAKKYSVSVGTVSKLTKDVFPKNEHVHNAQVVVLLASAALPPEEMNAIMNTAKDAISVAVSHELEVQGINQKFEKSIDGKGRQNTKQYKSGKR